MYINKKSLVIYLFDVSPSFSREILIIYVTCAGKTVAIIHPFLYLHPLQQDLAASPIKRCLCPLNEAVL